LESFERSVEVWKDWIRLKKELATLGEKLPPAELLPAKRKKPSPDPTKRGASKEEFGQRALAGGNMWDSLSCLLTVLESFDKNNPEIWTGSVARQMHKKTVQRYWVNTVKQQVTGPGGWCPTLIDTLIQTMEVSLIQITFLMQAKALLGKAIGEHTTQQHAEVKSIINKERQVAPKRMPFGARLVVNTPNIRGRFVESVKNARWSMRPQEAGDGLESILQLQVQIKGHNQREYEDKWQGWQNRNDEKLATKLTTDDQQQIWLLPARWWPDTLQELECGGWLQRPHKRVRCRQCKCSVVENPSFKSNKCHGCENRMQTKGERLDGIVFTNADPRYAGKIDDPQGGDTTMLIQQVREVMTVNQELEDESSWIWLTSEQMGVPLQNLRKKIMVKPEVRNNAMTSILIKPHISWRLSSQITFETQKGNSIMRSSIMRLKC